MRYALVILLLFSTNAPVPVAQLRQGRQSSVDMLHAQLLRAAPGQRAKLAASLDAVCAQKDCASSRLFWYTDLASARAAAKRLKRPILSLHLLGRLDEELSCANSRFFRVMLYSDPSINAILRDRYVLHWRSVRDVPTVTIRAGEGRVIDQTVTGNSIHYVLHANGQVLDGLPGLVSPAAFRQQLERWTELDRTLTQESLKRYHQQRLEAVNKNRIALGLDRIATSRHEQLRATAERAAAMARSKMAGERTLLSQLDLGASLRLLEPREWDAVADRFVGEVRFSPESLALMKRKGRISDAAIERLRRTVATDTVFNEHELHRELHQWFTKGDVGELDQLNQRVYATLFLTPLDDPWMGLNPEATFVGL